MATFLDKITDVRKDLHDNPRRTRDTWDGDAATTVFETTESPIRSGSYTVSVGGSEQTEGSGDDYTIDKDLGLITFTSGSIPASGTENVVIVYQHVKITDEDYLTLFNDALTYFKDKFWAEEFDDSSLTTVAKQRQYDMSTVDSEVFWVVNMQVESAAGNANFGAVTNWKYLPQLNKVEVNPTFAVGSLALRFHVLKRFPLASATGDTFPVPERYALPYKQYVMHRFFQRLIAEKMDLVGAVTTNATFIPGPAVISISQYFIDLADATAIKLAPKMPVQAVRQIQDGKIV